MALMPVTQPGLPPGLSGGLGLFGQLGGMPNVMSNMASGAIPPYPGIDPVTERNLKTQALITMGLGMLAGNEQGRGFGQSALQGLGMASSGYNEAMQNAFRSRTVANEDVRRDKELKMAEAVAKHNYQKDVLEVKDRHLAAQHAHEIALQTLANQAKQIQAAEAAAGAGRNVDVFKLQSLRDDAAELARLDAIGYVNLSESEKAKYNRLAGGTPQGMEAAQNRGLGNLLSAPGVGATGSWGAAIDAAVP